ncbi:MAG: hypothetical protein KF682_13830, partial [Nitrospira sp.]|nr:hypothetical protein [Nitrospira sp.]
RLAQLDGHNGGIFHTDPAHTSLLTSASVDAFGFLRSNPGAISVQGSQLTVSEGHKISLVGGNITIQSGTLNNGLVRPVRFSAPSGEINLASVNSPGQLLKNVPIEPENQSIANINGTSFTSFGSIHLAPGSTVDVSQTGNGKISIRGGQLVLDVHNALLSTTSSSASSAVTPGQDTIVLTAKSSIFAHNTSINRGPDVRIESDKISIVGVPSGGIRNEFTEKPFTGISSETQGSGDAGDILLRANGDIETSKVVSIRSVSHASGNAGSIELTSTHGNIRMIEGGTEAQGFSWSFDRGNTGNITVSARTGDVILNGAALYTRSLGIGRAGEVDITAKNLMMKLGLLGTFSSGLDKPGGVTVTVSDTLRMEADASFTLPKRVLPESLIFTASASSSPAADIDLTAKDIVVTNGSVINSAALGSGPGGRLKIVTDTLQVIEGAQLSSGSTRAPARGTLPQGIIPTGQGGEITIQALGPRGSVLVDGSKSGIFADTEGTGVGGTITLSAKTLTVQNGGAISASTTGTDLRAAGGSILLTAMDHVTLTNDASITASTSGPGHAGNILVKANDVAVGGGSTITASSTGTGNAGTVTIQGLQGPANTLLIDGGNSGISTRTSNTGAGGDITVSSNSVRIRNQGSISGETSGTTATATGGRILVTGETIRFENGALVTSSSTGAGSGGNITLSAEQSVTVRDNASVSASSAGTGAAGNVEIKAGKQFEVERGSITTQSNQLHGGNIAIQASDLVRVVDGKVSTSALNGGGNGGNITIDPKVVLLQNSEVLAQAKDGNGGSISIATPLYLKDQSSLVNADSQFGVNGTVTIQSPISNLSSAVGQLVSKTSPPQVLLQNRCVALAGGEQSTFLLAGRDALPDEPSGWLSSPVSVEHWTGEETEHAFGPMVQNRGLNASPTVTSQKNTPPVLSLRRLTPSGFLVRTFATGSTGCPS